MSKKKNFRKEWRSLTEIGNTFGVSARKLGLLLKKHGLRENEGEPSELAKKEGYCHFVDLKEGHGYYLWHGKKVTAYLEEQGEQKKGVSDQEASLNTEARKLARSYIEATKLDEEGSKLGYMMFDELRPEIKKVGLERFNEALKAVGFKGEPLTEENL
jgi:hypothetical protein